MLNILVVEDESIIANDIAATLKRLGHGVSAVVASGAEAINHVAIASPDLVLMDIKLQGGMDGIETAQYLLDHFKVPVVYLTAHAEDAMLRRAKFTEPFGYIVKPFKDQTIHTAIEMAVYKSQAQDALRVREAQAQENLEHLVVARTEEAASAYEKLRHAEKLEVIGQLAGGVAHDFNNLIVGILGIAQELQDRLQNDPEAVDDLGQIVKAGERAKGLTRQLLAIGRKQAVHPVVLNVNSILLDFEVMLQRLLGSGIQVVVNPGAIPRVKIDQSNLEQIVLNLAINARDAMPQGGTLTLSTTLSEIPVGGGDGRLLPGRYVLFETTDTGHGMSRDTMDHLFEPFFTTKKQEQGSGLGLAMVYGIVKQNGGDIQVQSAPGKGTTFRIFFPAVAGETAASLETPPGREQPKGHETILVVEDENIVRGVVVRRLRHLGYTVLHAGNGAQALVLAESHHGPIHLLITDVIMPGLNGRELAEQIKKIKGDIPVLFMSGFSQDVITSRGKVDPGIVFLEKSNLHAHLGTKVREQLDLAAAVK
jgi:two-component system cell cycle sensor histidine kinase/response regulator CckA